MGTGQPYSMPSPVATFSQYQWNTIKTNLSRNQSVCAGGFIFDWCDEYLERHNNFCKLGGPSAGFQARPGRLWDGAGFGVTSAVIKSTYGQCKLNIFAQLFKAYVR